MSDSAWGQSDDLGFADDSELAGADLRGADNRRASGILAGSDQARRPAQGASQHGDEIRSESFPQVSEIVKKHDVAGGHIRKRRPVRHVQVSRELLSPTGGRSSPHTLAALWGARFPGFAAFLRHCFKDLSYRQEATARRERPDGTR